MTKIPKWNFLGENSPADSTFSAQCYNTVQTSFTSANTCDLVTPDVLSNPATLLGGVFCPGAFYLDEPLHLTPRVQNTKSKRNMQAQSLYERYTIYSMLTKLLAAAAA